jgi:SAM-dependent methyltransferase
MSFSEQVQKDYNLSASSYGGYASLPSGQLESQLVKKALSDCTGLTVLDLGGGSGIHAREAVELGASRVDVVDISAGMLQVGRDIEESLARAAMISYFEADVSKPLSHLALAEGGYDIVMGNWIFSFADTLEMVEAIFSNIVSHLKPGGRFVGVRDADPWSPALKDGRYGGSCKWVKSIPGGVRYYCVLHSSPPVEFEGACLEIIYSGSTNIFERFGLEQVVKVPYESADIIRNNLEFWQLFLERPNLAVVSATKSVRT